MAKQIAFAKKGCRVLKILNHTESTRLASSLKVKKINGTSCIEELNHVYMVILIPTLRRRELKPKKYACQNFFHDLPLDAKSGSQNLSKLKTSSFGPYPKIVKIPD